MLLPIPIIVLKLAMLAAMGANLIVSTGIIVSECFLGALIGAWLTKREITLPTIFVVPENDPGQFQRDLSSRARKSPMRSKTFGTHGTLIPVLFVIYCFSFTLVRGEDGVAVARHEAVLNTPSIVESTTPINSLRVRQAREAITQTDDDWAFVICVKREQLDVLLKNIGLLSVVDQPLSFGTEAPHSDADKFIICDSISSGTICIPSPPNITGKTPPLSELENPVLFLVTNMPRPAPPELKHRFKWRHENRRHRILNTR